MNLDKIVESVKIYLAGGVPEENSLLLRYVMELLWDILE